MSKAMMAAVNLYHDPRYFNKSEERIRQNKLRRERTYRRQITILFTVLAIIFALGVFGGSAIRSNAESEDYTVDYKYYKNVVVGCGESLWTIAEDNISYDHYDDMNAYINEIMSINHISNKNSVTAGAIVTVPYYSGEFK
ncbi:MAG: hypothetical protein K6A23_12585 [Butyrivibrio sp.]|nr:hypothetical protein [Butyrivibrio sp.]